MKGNFYDIVESTVDIRSEVQSGRLISFLLRKVRSDLIHDINKDETFATPKGDHELKDPNEFHLSLQDSSRSFQAASQLDVNLNKCSIPAK